MLYWEGLYEEDRYYRYERKFGRVNFPDINATHIDVPGLSVGSSSCTVDNPRELSICYSSAFCTLTFKLKSLSW